MDAWEAGESPARSRHCDPGAAPARRESATGETWEGCGGRVRYRGARRPVSVPHRTTPSARRGATVADITFRASLAAACAAGLVAAPAALPLDTAIRVEGSSANLIPESAIPIEGDGTAQVFDSQFAPVDVSRASAFWQLYRATVGHRAGAGFTYFPAFTALLVNKVGPDANAGTAGWQFRVNHVGATVGADATPLKQGDSVLWYYGAADGARELDVTPSARTACPPAPRSP